MAIISKSNDPKLRGYGSNFFRFGMIHVAITFLVLVLLNMYCSDAAQKLFYRSKEISMQEKAQLVAAAIAEEDVLNAATAGEVIRGLDNLQVTRMVVTDHAGQAVYDSLSERKNSGDFCLFPEIVQALEGNNVFTSRYHAGGIESQAACPILSYNRLIGCVYISEYDTEQGQLIESLQINTLGISLVLIVILSLFSLFCSKAFSRRIDKIMTSMRIIREGDYTHKVEMNGRDELAVLGDEFNDLTDRLQESEQRRRQFVSDASHELKTPLASIKLLSDSILQNDMDMDTVREFVADIGNEADRLNRMSTKLLSLTKIGADCGADCEITFVGPTIRRVVRMASATAASAGVTVEAEIREDSSILILEDDLYQIIFNLVENGIKYNLPGGTLKLILFRQDDNAVLQVCDTGPGIPEASLPHIFERFYRVDKARSRQSGGSGLGLAIVHDMIERNRGHIRVESTVGEHHGTTFTLEMPVFDMDDQSEDADFEEDSQ